MRRGYSFVATPPGRLQRRGGFLASPARKREDADVPEPALVDVEACVARAIAEHKAKLVDRELGGSSTSSSTDESRGLLP